mmetsp:Transcript_49833/g.147283  ORF Transcript_49833/g.147283 Transcript_49833/m.147283 type:complete len:777 (-) Transcript_49833:843-3173(-)
MVLQAEVLFRIRGLHEGLHLALVLRCELPIFVLVLLLALRAQLHPGLRRLHQRLAHLLGVDQQGRGRLLRHVVRNRRHGDHHLLAGALALALHPAGAVDAPDNRLVLLVVGRAVELLQGLAVGLLGLLLPLGPLLLLLLAKGLPKLLQLLLHGPEALELGELLHHLGALRGSKDEVGRLRLLRLALPELVLGLRESFPLAEDVHRLEVLPALLAVPPLLHGLVVLGDALLRLPLPSALLLLAQLLEHLAHLPEVLAGACVVLDELLHGVGRLHREVCRLLRGLQHGLAGLGVDLPDRGGLDVELPLLARLERGHGLVVGLRGSGGLGLERLPLRVLQGLPLVLQHLANLEALEHGLLLLHRGQVAEHELLESGRRLLRLALQVLELSLGDALRALRRPELPEVRAALLARLEGLHLLHVLLLKLVRLVRVLLLLLWIHLRPYVRHLGDGHLALLLPGEAPPGIGRLRGEVERLVGQRDDAHAVLQHLDDLLLVAEEALHGDLQALGLRDVLLPLLHAHVLLRLLGPLLELILHLALVLVPRELVKLDPLLLVLHDLVLLDLLAARLARRLPGHGPFLVQEEREGRPGRLRRRPVQELDRHHLHGIVHELHLDLLVGLHEALVLVGLLPLRHLAHPLLLHLLLLRLERGLLLLGGLRELLLQGVGPLALALAGRHLRLVLVPEHGEDRLGSLRLVDQAHHLVLPGLGLEALLQELRVILLALELEELLVVLVLQARGGLLVPLLLLLRHLGPHARDLLAHLAHGQALALLGDLRHHL